MKAIKWVRDGEILKDAGDVGGDIQVGPAVQIRFRSDEQPDARFDVTVYATAKLYMDLKEDEPDCPHTEPEGWVCKNGWQEDHGPDFPNGTRCVCWLPPEHLACSYKPGTVDLQAEFSYRRGGTTESGHYESDDEQITYDWVGSDLAYDHGGRRTLNEEIAYATADAYTVVLNWGTHVNQWLHWDGVSNVND